MDLKLINKTVLGTVALHNFRIQTNEDIVDDDDDMYVNHFTSLNSSQSMSQDQLTPIVIRDA